MLNIRPKRYYWLEVANELYTTLYDCMCVPKTYQPMNVNSITVISRQCPTVICQSAHSGISYEDVKQQLVLIGNDGLLF